MKYFVSNKTVHLIFEQMEEADIASIYAMVGNKATWKSLDSHNNMEWMGFFYNWNRGIVKMKIIFIFEILWNFKVLRWIVLLSKSISSHFEDILFLQNSIRCLSSEFNHQTFKSIFPNKKLSFRTLKIFMLIRKPLPRFSFQYRISKLNFMSLGCGFFFI